MIDERDPGTLPMPLHFDGDLIGYARVSTPDQNIDLQIQALKAAGCRRVFTDVVSGVKSDRPGLSDALEYMRAGDTLVMWKLDRLGRSLPHLIELIETLRQRDMGFKTLTDAIDTTTPSGRLVFHLFAALAEYERELIRERTIAGLAAAKAQGRTGGRKPVVTPAIRKRALEMREKGLSIRAIAAALKVGKSALYNALNDDQGEGSDS